MKHTLVLIAFFVAAVFFRVISRLVSPHEGFAQQEVGMPVDGGGEGLYNGLEVDTGLWASSEKPVSLKPYENADDTQLFQFQTSKFTPECCPSSISNDIGCLCPSKQEERSMVSRGGNRLPL